LSCNFWIFRRLEQRRLFFGAAAEKYHRTENYRPKGFNRGFHKVSFFVLPLNRHRGRRICMENFFKLIAKAKMASLELF
jgi:hypothetical protein